MKSWDAHWIAMNGTIATFVYAIQLEAVIEDVDAAVADGDWATTLECVAIGYLWVAQCEAALEGIFTEDEEGPLVVLATLSEHHETLARMPPRVATGEADCRDEVAKFHACCERLRLRLPFAVPSMRTPSGFFPAVRLAKELERLRSALGVPPLSWDFAL